MPYRHVHEAVLGLGGGHNHLFYHVCSFEQNYVERYPVLSSPPSPLLQACLEADKLSKFFFSSQILSLFGE